MSAVWEEESKCRVTDRTLIPCVLCLGPDGGVAELGEWKRRQSEA